MMLFHFLQVNTKYGLVKLKSTSNRDKYSKSALLCLLIINIL
jgi:hypothetical protein